MPNKDPEKKRQSERAWRRKNPERVRSIRFGYAEKNRDEIKVAKALKISVPEARKRLRESEK